MNSSILLRSMVSLTLLACSAFGGYVVVLPPPGQSSVYLFTEDLKLVGSVDIPATALQAYTDPSGSKLMVVTTNSSAAVTYADITPGPLGKPPVLSVTPVLINLNSQGAVASAISRDGTRLLVAGDSTAGNVFVIDTRNTLVALSQQLQLGSRVKDLEISPDSRFFYVLTERGDVSVYKLQTLEMVRQHQKDQLPLNVKSISVSPTGRVFLSADEVLCELKGYGDFAIVGQTRIPSSRIGKLYFFGGDQHAVAADEPSSGASIRVFDALSKGEPVPGSPASIRLRQSLVIQSNGTVLKPDQFLAYGENKALAYVGANKNLYEVDFENLTVTAKSFDSRGDTGTLTGFTVSGEFPTPRSLYFAASVSLTRYREGLGADQLPSELPKGRLSFLSVPGLSTYAENVQVLGAGQVALPGAALDYYGIRLLDQGGLPVFGTKVALDVQGVTGVEVEAKEATTNSDGVALFRVTKAPPVAGPFTVTVNAGTRWVPFTSTVMPAGGGSGGGQSLPRILKIDGDGQLLQLPGFGQAQTLRVKLVDASGNPLEGKTVTWKAGSGLTLSTSPETMTDANGVARMDWVPAGQIPNGSSLIPYIIRATSEVGAVEFRAVGHYSNQQSPNPPTVRFLAPTTNTDVLETRLGTPLKDAIRIHIAASSVEAGVENVPNVSIRLVTTSSQEQGPVVSCLGQDLPLTGADGIGNCTLVATGAPGEAVFTVNVGNGFRTFSGYRVRVLPGEPLPEKLPDDVSGDGQTGTLGATLKPFKARITDGAGNIQAGAAVKWDIVSGTGITFTAKSEAADSAGLVTATIKLGTTPGRFTVRLTTISSNKYVEFTGSAIASVSRFEKVSGDPQTAIVGAKFSLPLVVRVLDAAGNPLPGELVTFKVDEEGSATLSTDKVVSDGNGQASVTVTAGSSPDAEIKVTASVPGAPGVVFKLQSLPLPPPKPELKPESFFSASSGEVGVTPGGLTFIVGRGLVPTLNGQLNAPMFAGRLPLTLLNLTVEFRTQGGNAWAPIYAASNTNGKETVLIQAPYEIGGEYATVIVTAGEVSTTVEKVAIKPVIPGFVRDWIGEREQAVVIHPDGRAVTPTNPARRGEKLLAYATGLGQTAPQAAITNAVGVAGQNIKGEVTLGIGKTPERVLTPTAVYLAPNLIGIYAIEFEMPADAETGTDVRFTFTIRPTPGGEAVFDQRGTIIAIAP